MPTEDVDTVETPAYEIAKKFAHGDESLAEEIRLAMRSAIAIEREACASKAREFAAHYPQSSDGRNTFILLAEWIENHATAQST